MASPRSRRVLAEIKPINNNNVSLFLLLIRFLEVKPVLSSLTLNQAPEFDHDLGNSV